MGHNFVTRRTYSYHDYITGICYGAIIICFAVPEQELSSQKLRGD
jgi:hypothetical protein